MYTLLACPGWGSAIVEAMLESAGLPYAVEDLDPLKSAADRERLRALNPLVQIPTLLMPDGSAMTESAAITMHVGDHAPASGLVPAAGAYREGLWRQIEAAIEPRPWFLGSRFSALDIYLCVMTRWRPRRAWFPANCPKVNAIALAVDALPSLAKVWKRNFG